MQFKIVNLTIARRVSTPTHKYFPRPNSPPGSLWVPGDRWLYVTLAQLRNHLALWVTEILEFNGTFSVSWAFHWSSSGLQDFRWWVNQNFWLVPQSDRVVKPIIEIALTMPSPSSITFEGHLWGNFVFVNPPVLWMSVALNLLPFILDWSSSQSGNYFTLIDDGPSTGAFLWTARHERSTQHSAVIGYPRPRVYARWAAHSLVCRKQEASSQLADFKEDLWHGPGYLFGSFHV